MKRKLFITIVFVSMLFIVKAQDVYHSDDKEALRTFLRQPSANEHLLNIDQLWISEAIDTSNWEIEEAWIESIEGLTWNDSTVKRLIQIHWNSKKLAGSLNLSQCADIISIYCNDNQLSRINLRSCQSVELLDCRDNKLYELDIIESSSFVVAADGQEIIHPTISIDESGSIPNPIIFNGESVSNISVHGGTYDSIANTINWTPSSDFGVIKFDFSVKIQLQIDSLLFPFPTIIFSGTVILPWKKWGAVVDETELVASKLRNFLRQPSAVSGTLNIDNLWNKEVPLDTNNWNNDHSWLYNIDGLNWSEDSIEKQLLQIYWNEKNLAGELDLSGCSSLIDVHCDNNKLNMLNISNCSNIHILSCNGNNLYSLNVSNCPELSRLICLGNNLTTLDISSNTKLEMIYCAFNHLTSIDVKHLALLQYLECSGNHIMDIDIRNCNRIRMAIAWEQTISLPDQIVDGDQFYLHNPIFYNGSPVSSLSFSPTGNGYFDGDDHVLTWPTTNNSGITSISFNVATTQIGFTGSVQQKWVKRAVATTVTFDFQYENITTSSIVERNTPTSPPQNMLYRPGLVINGWYTEPDCINRWDFQNPVTQDMTLYAYWTENLNIHTAKKSSLVIYPNPASEKITIAGLQGGEEIGMYDITGRQIKNLLASDQKEVIQISDFPSGLYFIRVKNVNRVETLKWIKQ